MKKHFDLLSLSVLVLLGPLFVFPNGKWNWVLLLVVVIQFIVHWIIERRVFTRTPIDGAICLLLFMALAGIFIIKDVGESAAKLAGLVYGVIFFFRIVDVLKTQKRVKIAIIVFLAMGFLLAIVGTLGRLDSGKPNFLSSEFKAPKIPRVALGLKGAESGFNPNPLGGILLLFIPIGLIQISILLKKDVSYLPPWIKCLSFVVLIILLIIQALAVYYSQSLGVLISISIALWLMGVRKRPIKALVVVIILIVIVNNSLKIWEAVEIPNQKENYSLNSSITMRIQIWKNSNDVVMAHPIIGIGMDQLRRTPKFSYVMAHAHNQFLHTAAELGIPGLIAYIAILIGVFWMAGELRQSALPEWMRLTARGLGAGIFAFTLFGMGDAIPLGAKPGIFFWISIAVITSIYRYGQNNGFLTKSQKQV